MVPTISVVVTCYNYGKYIQTCLESIRRQTLTDFEVIIVDDGSTDNSAEQISPFLLDNRFNYIKQQNKGQANAKNRGLKETNARFVAFLDADDLWLPEKLENQLLLFDKPEVGVVYCGVSRIDTNGNPFPTARLIQYLQPRRNHVPEFLIYDNFVPFSSVIVRKECFDSLGVFDESLSMGIDWDLWLRFSTKYQFDFCEDAYLLYRVEHSGQMSKKTLERFHCADRILEKFKRDFPKVVSKSILNDAEYYSCCLRGYALRKYGIRYPLKYYLRAISLFPLRTGAYIGLFKAPLRTMCNR